MKYYKIMGSRILLREGLSKHAMKLIRLSYKKQKIDPGRMSESYRLWAAGKPTEYACNN